jgi:hypothetical protein
MPDNYGYRHTLRICNAYCFSTASMVTQTHLNVTLYAHGLSRLCFEKMTRRQNLSGLNVSKHSQTVDYVPSKRTKQHLCVSAHSQFPHDPASFRKQFSGIWCPAAWQQLTNVSLELPTSIFIVIIDSNKHHNQCHKNSRSRIFCSFTSVYKSTTYEITRIKEESVPIISYKVTLIEWSIR